LWRDIYQVLFSDDRFRLGEEQVPKILGLAGMSERHDLAVLDLCCGPGRHAIPLAKRGLKVTAVDRSPFLLDRGRERARLEDLTVEFVESDMREFRRPGVFDLALSLLTSFGYFAAREEDVQVLRNVRTSLRPEGVFVMDMVGKEWLARHFQPTRSRTLPD